MARNWIKIETVTCDKPEVCVVATQLKVDPDMVVGKLVRLWSWAEVNRINGNEMNVTFEFIDKLVGKRGFATALAKAGWLREVGDKLQFPNFGRHNGPNGKGRALTAQRVSRHREKKRNSDEAATNTIVDEPMCSEIKQGPRIKPRNERKNTVKELIESDSEFDNTQITEANYDSEIPVFEGKIVSETVEIIATDTTELPIQVEASVAEMEATETQDNATKRATDELASSSDHVTRDEVAVEALDTMVTDQNGEAQQEVGAMTATADPVDESASAQENGEEPEAAGSSAQKGRKGRSGIATPRKIVVPETPDQPLLF